MPLQFLPELLLSFGLAVAIAAENRAIAARLERNFSVLATGRANSGEHLAASTGTVSGFTTGALRLSSLAARGATLRLVGVTTRGKEFLFLYRKGEGNSAIGALE